jgi:hypothetical protein
MSFFKQPERIHIPIIAGLFTFGIKSFCNFVYTRAHAHTHKHTHTHTYIYIYNL